MTWCSHRKGVNEGLSAAAALLAAIKADVLLLPHLSPPFTPSPPPFYSVRLVLVGLRQENIALCVRVCPCVCVVEGDVRVVSVVFGGGTTPDMPCHPSCYHRSVRFIRMCLPRPVPLT